MGHERTEGSGTPVLLLVSGVLAIGVFAQSAPQRTGTIGPATELANLRAVKIVLGRGRFVVYLLFVIAGACVTGALVD